MPKYLDQKAFQIVNGGIPQTTKLLDQKFDHILYTGNATVARVKLANKKNTKTRLFDMIN